MATRHRRGGSRSAARAHTHLTDAGHTYSDLDRIIDTLRQPLIVLDEKVHHLCQPRLLPRLCDHAGGDHRPTLRGRAVTAWIYRRSAVSSI